MLFRSSSSSSSSSSYVSTVALWGLLLIRDRAADSLAPLLLFAHLYQGASSLSSVLDTDADASLSEFREGLQLGLWWHSCGYSTAWELYVELRSTFRSVAEDPFLAGRHLSNL